MYLQKVPNKQKNLETCLKVTDKKSRIRKAEIRIRGSIPKCHGSATLSKSLSDSVSDLALLRIRIQDLPSHKKQHFTSFFALPSCQTFLSYIEQRKFFDNFMTIGSDTDPYCQCGSRSRRANSMRIWIQESQFNANQDSGEPIQCGSGSRRANSTRIPPDPGEPIKCESGTQVHSLIHRPYLSNIPIS
jgi:hypothetical protein